MTVNHNDIEIISGDGLTSISEQTIRETLNAEQVEVAHGEHFTGRPVTAVIVSGDCVIKLRREYHFDAVNARRFAQKAIQKEADIGLYHPDKTWFLIHDPNEDTPLIANITPRLTTLNQTDIAEQLGFDRFIILIHTLLDHYLCIAQQQELCLDLGLSNFGIDENGTLYYLDDDSYAWDNFTALAEFLGIFLRSQNWLTDAIAEALGAYLHERIMHYFHEPQWAMAMAEHLKSSFMPEAKQSQAQAMCKGLRGGTGTVQYRGGNRENSSKVIALIADIHGNAPALEATLKFIQSHNVDQCLMLGDVVGYGPHPNQCVDILRAERWISPIRGNHDHAAAYAQAVAGMNGMARWSMEWTNNTLTITNREWLKTLPTHIEDENWLAVHGAPKDKTFFNAYVYMMTYVENLDELENRDIRWCFHGHSHVPKVYYRHKQDNSECSDQQQRLGEYQHALICPGSVGQSRSQKAGAQLALFDTDSGELEFHRIAYDLRTTVEDMQSYCFPSDLVSRLISGR